MSIVNPIKYQIFEGYLVPNSNPPVINIESDSMAYGTIIINLSQFDSIGQLTFSVFRIVPPTADEDRWLRQGSDLWPIHPTCLNATWLINSENQIIITWKFLPSVISGANNEYYSLEFFVHQTLTSVIVQSPKIIIKVKDKIL